MEKSFSEGVHCICQRDKGFTTQSGFVLQKLQLGLSYGEFIHTNEPKLPSYSVRASQSLNKTF